MKIITSIFDLNKEIKNYKNIGFVPTMGGIHAGHESLIKTSQKKKVNSLFVVEDFKKEITKTKLPATLVMNSLLIKKTLPTRPRVKEALVI